MDKSETEDPLSFKSLVQRWAYFGVMSISDTANPGTRPLYMSVAPDSMFRNTNGAFYYLPVCIPTLFMAKWSGSMMYRFTVVASPQHRGAILITYDTAQTQKVMPELNMIRGVVLDLAEKRSVTVMVPMTQETPYLGCTVWEPGWDSIVDRPYSFDPTTGPYQNDLYNYHDNGYIQVHVLNRICSPNSIANASPAYVVVEVAGCADMRFAEPWERFRFLQTSFPQVEQELALEVGPATCEDMVNLGLGCEIRSDIDKTYFGESVLSLREIAQRYHLQFQKIGVVPGVVGLQQYVLLYGGLPWLQGRTPDNEPMWAANGSPSTVSTYNYSFTYTTHMSLIALMFAGFMCNTRHMITVNSSEPGQVESISVGRLGANSPQSRCWYESVNFYGPTGPYSSGIWGRISACGMAWTSWGVTKSLKIEVPAYSRFLLWSGRTYTYPIDDYYWKDGEEFMVTQKIVLSVELGCKSGSAVNLHVKDYIAGSDIRVACFVGLPPMAWQAFPLYDPTLNT